jgi:uncharacterized protein YbjQ (UPF0145 family)
LSRQETVVECSIVGTAVATEGLKPPREPLVSPLSADDFYALWTRGYVPVSWALGFHRHCMPVGFRTRSITSSWNFLNQELTSVTERLMEIRQYALHRMIEDAREAGQRVDGLVGVTVQSSIEETEITMFAGYGNYGWGGGVTIDGTFYPYDNGRCEVPAYNVEFFAQGAGVARIAARPLTAQEIIQVLWAAP